MISIDFAYPWLLALLPLPLLVWWLLPVHSEPRRGLVVPFLPRLAELTGHDASAGATVARGSIWRLFVLLFCWLCVVLALARPQVLEPPVSRDLPVRDLLLAVDLSGSMETKDFKDAYGNTVDRLTAVKSVLDDFLMKRVGDRVGLIFFGNSPFVQAPFTQDLEVCRELLDEAQAGMAGPQTAFGDALGLAINVFDRSEVKDRVLIALTDGNDTSSKMPPAKAAQIAHDKGIVIHTVAVGDPSAAGEDALDEETLKSVATSTGGLYSRANDRQQLESIYAQLDKLESRQVNTVSHRPRQDVYWAPLAAALLASLVYLTVGLLRHAHLNRHRAGTASLASVAPAGMLASDFHFHFIRPEWLLAVIPAMLVWWGLRQRADSGRAWRGIIAPHLLKLLWGGEERRSRFGPLMWLGIGWLLVIVAIAGPTWKRAPSPFADETAALAIVIKVSPSMETEDIQPSRLDRATLKIQDLLAARGKAKTSLIAYAGSAHRVMPATDDAGIINTFAQSLKPDIMPESGDVAARALELADQSLADAGGGSILWITDSIATEQSGALAEWRKQSGTQVRLWPPLLQGSELDALEETARLVDADIQQLAADDSDIQSLANAAKFGNVLSPDHQTRWVESGYWLTPLLALILLMFFRRGWMVPKGTKA